MTMTYFMTGSGSGATADNTIPAGAVICTQDQAEASAFWMVSNGEVVAAPGVSLEQAKATQYAALIASAEAAFDVLAAPYPTLELHTWDRQAAEASAYLVSNTAPTPLLSAIAAASGQAIADLAARVNTLAASFVASSGAIIGKRQALGLQIYSATTLAAVQAVVWF
jgi:hypothetical protein